MPTPDDDASNAPHTTSIDYSAAACPGPLTPPAEDDNRERSSRSNVTTAPSALSGEWRRRGDVAVNNNTAAGMAASQEESLYLSPRSTSAAEAMDVDDAAESEKMDRVLEETLAGKPTVELQQATGRSDALVSPLSPRSLSPCSPTRNAQSAGQDFDLTREDDRPSYRAERNVRIHGSNLDQEYTSGRLLPGPGGGFTVSQGMPSVDRELDWTSSTPNWDFTHKRLVPAYPSALFQCDSRYEGTQQSDRQNYSVAVRILTVDMDQCSCTGYLTINGLTPEHETLQTYFTGEIIGGPEQRHSFRTKTSEWGASDKTDLTHWARFHAWRPCAPHAKKDLDFAYPPNGEAWWQQDNVFMRWKEHFLVPDHKTKSIAGASFEGFYYICLNQLEGRISGIYFHSKSERFQQLELTHEGVTGVWHRGVTPCVEFR